MASSIITLHQAFPKSVLQELNKLRSASLFCDIILEIEDWKFPAHRCVLVSASTYFQNMLKGKYVESKAEKIKLKELNPSAFAVLLNYMYTGVLSINCTNAGEILRAADYLQLQWPRNECSKYLLDVLTPGNAIGLWEYGRGCSCNELETEANKLILINLKSILNTNEFKELELQKLEEIFDHEQMQLTPADDVFIAIIEWMKYDLPNRKPSFNALSKYIRSGSISNEFLRSDIPKEAFLREDVSISNWMLDNLLFSRINEPLNTNIFISALRAESNCYKYDTKMNESTLLTKPYLNAYYPVHYKNDIYFTCGRVKNVYKKVCPKYNIKTGSWSKIPFESDRFYHGSSVLNDKMYIAGGLSDQDVFRNDVITYDFETGELISLQSRMYLKKAYFGIAVQNGSIYTCGGMGCDYEPLNTVERFDPREGKWALNLYMNELRGWCTSAFVSDELYCSARYENIVKKFDIRMNSWERISYLPFSCSGDTCLVTNQGQLYAVTRKHIYEYNRSEDNWNQIYSTSIYSLGLFVIATSF